MGYLPNTFSLSLVWLNPPRIAYSAPLLIIHLMYCGLLERRNYHTYQYQIGLQATCLLTVLYLVGYVELFIGVLDDHVNSLEPMHIMPPLGASNSVRL